jgi:hypothetical protein
VRGVSDTKPEPLSKSLDKINEAAMEHAKRFNLICDNGQIVCLRKGCGLEATLPSLLCAEHLAMHRRGQR